MRCVAFATTPCSPSCRHIRNLVFGEGFRLVLAESGSESWVRSSYRVCSNRFSLKLSRPILHDNCRGAAIRRGHLVRLLGPDKPRGRSRAAGSIEMRVMREIDRDTWVKQGHTPV